MSLFDVIRYPVTDIYDPTQLKPIPRPIISEWEDYIKSLYSIVKDPSIGSATPIWMFAKICVFDIALDITTRPGCDESITDCFDRLTNLITNHLIQLIKDYDDESL